MLLTQKGNINETDDVCDLDPIKWKKRWLCNLSIRWTLITLGRRYLFFKYKIYETQFLNFWMKKIPNNQKLLNFPIFSFYKYLNAKIFLQRLNNFNSFFLKSNHIFNGETNAWSKKTSTFPTLFPNQTHNVDQNEMIRKLFVKYKQKLSLNQLTAQNIKKKIQNSK